MKYILAKPMNRAPRPASIPALAALADAPGGWADWPRAGSVTVPSLLVLVMA